MARLRACMMYRVSVRMDRPVASAAAIPAQPAGREENVAAVSDRHWQLQIPAHSADRTGSQIVIARALCARGNLGKAVTFSPEVPNYPAKYCEIPTSLRSSE